MWLSSGTLIFITIILAVVMYLLYEKYKNEKERQLWRVTYISGLDADIQAQEVTTKITRSGYSYLGRKEKGLDAQRECGKWFYKRAQNYAQAGAYKAAADDYKKCLNYSPPTGKGLDWAQLGLVLCYIELGYTQEAADNLSIISSAIIPEKLSYSDCDEIAKAYFRLGDYKNTIKYYEYIAKEICVYGTPFMTKDAEDEIKNRISSVRDLLPALRKSLLIQERKAKHTSKT